jgi:hypothetical protein
VSYDVVGRRTWPPQLPAGSASTAPHPKLQAVSFPEGLLTSLTTLSALAPNLHSLSCHTLVLRAINIDSTNAKTAATAIATAAVRTLTGTRNSSGEGMGGEAAPASSSRGGEAVYGHDSTKAVCGSGSLPHCTAFAAEAVSIAAGDEAEAGQAFAAALPCLRVSNSTAVLVLVGLAMCRGGCDHFVVPVTFTHCSNLPTPAAIHQPMLLCQLLSLTLTDVFLGTFRQCLCVALCPRY